MGSSTLTTMSIILVILGFFSFSKTGQSKVSVGLFFIMTIGSMFLFVAYAVADYFSGNGIDEATIYHLEYGLGGAGYLEYIWLILITIAALMLGSSCVFYYIRKSKPIGGYGLFTSLIPSSFVSVSLLINPASVDLYKLHESNLMFLGQSMHQDIKGFSDYYRKSNIQKLNGSHKNIVYIYAESLERTYFDEDVFPGLIKGLRELESNSTYFTNIRQAVGTGWTIGGIMVWTHPS